MIEVAEQSSVLTQMGCENIICASAAKEHAIRARVGDRVHKTCCQDLVKLPYEKITRPGEENSPSSTVSIRSETHTFSSKDHCIFCGQTAKYNGKKRGFDVNPVRTTEFQESIDGICKQRNDEWSDTLLGRLEYLRDLHARDAVYH